MEEELRIVTKAYKTEASGIKIEKQIVFEMKHEIKARFGETWKREIYQAKYLAMEIISCVNISQSTDKIN